MRRRQFISLLGSAAVAWPLAARAQQAGQVRRIGVLIGFAESDPDVQSWLAALRGALAKLGWTEGSNLQIELRWAGDDPDRIKTFAKELVDLRPDAILSVTTPVTGALVRETQTIPIVIVTVADPISSGFVTSLGRPGGNVTGFALYEPGMGGKWLELLKQIAPGVTRVALLFNPATSVPVKFYMSSIEAAASLFAIQASTAPVHAKDEIEGAIAALAGNPGAGLIVMPDLFNTINRDLIVALAARYRVPAIYFVRSFADSGGLISYGPDLRRTVSPGSRVHRPHPQGREASGPSDPNANQSTVSHQPKDSKCAWPRRAVASPTAR